MRDFHNSEGWSSGNFKKEYVGTLKDKLFQEYADNLANMLRKKEANQNKLLEVLDKLFAFQIDHKTEKKIIIIHPKLTSEGLDEAEALARKYIRELYIGCEEDFIKGIDIFEAIVGKQLLDTNAIKEANEANRVEKEKFIQDNINQNVRDDDDDDDEYAMYRYQDDVQDDVQDDEQDEEEGEAKVEFLTKTDAQSILAQQAKAAAEKAQEAADEAKAALVALETSQRIEDSSTKENPPAEEAPVATAPVATEDAPASSEDAPNTPAQAQA